MMLFPGREARRIVKSLSTSQPLYPIKGGLVGDNKAAVMCTLCSQIGPSKEFRHSDSCPFRLAVEWVNK